MLPAFEDPEHCAVDPFLIAADLSADAVLAYHSALEVQGRAYSSFNEVQFVSRRRMQPFEFRGTRYRPLTASPALVRAGCVDFGVEPIDRAGSAVQVTGLERTLVDALDRPDLCGGWEEVWRSLEMVEYLNLQTVCDYALALGNATTVAKTGWYLEAHRESLMVEDSILEALRQNIPASPHYLSRGSTEPTRYLSNWNLVVPRSLLDRHWEEPQ